MKKPKDSNIYLAYIHLKIRLLFTKNKEPLILCCFFHRVCWIGKTFSMWLYKTASDMKKTSDAHTLIIIPHYLSAKFVPLHLQVQNNFSFCYINTNWSLYPQFKHNTTSLSYLSFNWSLYYIKSLAFLHSQPKWHFQNVCLNSISKMASISKMVAMTTFPLLKL
jgi:hypothetical protein